MPTFNFPQPLDPDLLFKILSTHPEFNSQSRLVSLANAAHTINRDDHDGRTLMFDRAAGVTATLPAAIGSGCKLRFIIKTVAMTNNHIVKVANATDVIQGSIWISDTDTAGTTTAFSTAADSDTITLNRTTTGSIIKGEVIELEDIAPGVWIVRGHLANTASGATPFSAGV